MSFLRLDPDLVRRRLEPPSRPVRAVLDTDTYNEIDDQFALVYSLLASESIQLDSVFAAPFLNSRSTSPADGMERSYAEIFELFKRLNLSRDNMVFRGSTGYLPDRHTPVESPAARALVDQALAAGTRGEVLYVMAIAAITNVASAILMCPEIVNHIVIVWLGGNPYGWKDNSEFNLKQDVPAAQVIFDCGAPVVHIPCKNVAEHLNTSIPEMACHVQGRGAIGDYLFESFAAYVRERDALTKVVWDIAAPAFLAVPQYLYSEVIPAPILNDDRSWTMDPSRHPLRVITGLNRDGIFRDLFRHLDHFAAAGR